MTDAKGRWDELPALSTRLVSRHVKDPARGSFTTKNNSGLAIQFAAAGGIIYRRALAEGSNRTIPTEWLGSDLSTYYQSGFRPLP
jgi:hypothetical protein